LDGNPALVTAKDKNVNHVLSDDDAKDAQAQIDAIKKLPAKVTITSNPPGAKIEIDGAVVGDKTTPAEIELAPGTHKIELTANGMLPYEHGVDVAPISGGQLSASLDAIPPPPPPPVAASASASATPAPVLQPVKRDMTWVWITGGGAVVALGLGATFGIMALKNKSDFDNACNNPSAPNANANAVSARDDGTRNALISDVGFGVGFMLAITSVVLAFAPNEESKAKAGSFHLTPFVGPNTAGASALVRF
jgi:hypothetical protein